MFPHTVLLKTFIYTDITRSSSCIRTENDRLHMKCHQCQYQCTCYKELHVIINIEKLTAQEFGGQSGGEQAERNARTHAGTHRAIYSICLDISLQSLIKYGHNANGASTKSQVSYFVQELHSNLNRNSLQQEMYVQGNTEAFSPNHSSHGNAIIIT